MRIRLSYEEYKQLERDYFDALMEERHMRSQYIAGGYTHWLKDIVKKTLEIRKRNDKNYPYEYLQTIYGSLIPKDFYPILIKTLTSTVPIHLSYYFKIP